MRVACPEGPSGGKAEGSSDEGEGGDEGGLGTADEEVSGERGDALLRGPCKALDLMRDVFE